MDTAECPDVRGAAPPDVAIRARLLVPPRAPTESCIGLSSRGNESNIRPGTPGEGRRAMRRLAQTAEWLVGRKTPWKTGAGVQIGREKPDFGFSNSFRRSGGCGLHTDRGNGGAGT